MRKGGEIGTDFEEFLYDQRCFYRCDAASGDEENISVVGCSSEPSNVI
jgi:hypothetical protein